ncbi:flagellar biosynthesis protein FlhA [Mesoaciditoga lauensis]|uniref:flagellar biosynthesis protein FlhA n=1 Tax=Mesoaciditoga lauensis TaxID=1495039 RepID=UPI0005663FB2|nr:flagellar biosynthesis protein FlhA [Mesoaciditoga lauensis]
MSKYDDIFVAIGVLFIVLLLILPISGWALDLLQILDITISVLVLLVAMYLKRAVDLSSFPTIVLVLTIYRVALNVASTRLILLQGKNFQGHVIRAFGDFVVGGNYVVGIVVFFILVIVQFIVITKGAERIAEVAARFTLDAMPGKQMSIDADYNAGIITEEEARRRREEVRREADFYGAMDGASKFVRGDAISSIIIVFINIIGGLIIGVLMHHMGAGEAAQVYTLLTVGDGLVTQIPALLVSTSSGIIVSRAASTSSLGKDILRELSQEPRALMITGAAILLLGIFTPLPTISMVLVGFLTVALGYMSSRATPRKEAEELGGSVPSGEAPHPGENVPSPGTMDISDIITTDTVEVEIGYGLIPLADRSQGGDLLERVTMVRKQIAHELGFMLSPIRVRDSVLLKPNEYVIKILGSEIAKYEIFPNRLLAMNPGMVEEKIEGIPTKEPAFGLEAFWITEDQRETARGLGYTVVDAPSVFATHLTEILREHAAELLGRKEMEMLIEGLREKIPSLVNELIPGIMKEHMVRKVLQRLLEEKVSLRNLPLIFETLIENGEKTSSISELVQKVRIALKRQISESAKSDDGYVHAVALSQALEEKLMETMTISEDRKIFSINPDLISKIIDAIASSLKKVMEKGHYPVVICSASIREAMARYVIKNIPKIQVVAYEEMADDVKLKIEEIVNV